MDSLTREDILSDVLRGVRLRGAVFFYLSFGRDWATGAPPAKDIAALVLPGAEHVMEYHVITRGAAWAAVVGQPPVRLAPGDIVMFPHGDAHVLSSGPDLKAKIVDADWISANRQYRPPITLNDLGDNRGMEVAKPASDALTNIVCGFWGCDLRPFNPLIAQLPSMLHLPAGRDGAWIIDTLQQAVSASFEKRPGSEVVLERISEIMFVQAVGRHIAEAREESGWIAGLQDRHVGRALALLHSNPAEAWTVDELGQRVGLSRSALHERFIQLIGQPPMQYLTQWRMQLAAKLLRTTNNTVASVALDVGYESEAAFARAFKRLVGSPPATWRRHGDPTRTAGHARRSADT
jgi:AraC-like DNA-binding protein